MDSTTKPIIVTQLFDTSINKVWSAITEVEQMKKWYFPVIDFFEPEVGFETQFIIQVEDRVFQHQWKVIEVIPQKKISYQWKFEGYPGTGVSTFELTEESHQIELKLTFTTLENFPQDIPEFKRESGVEGWNYLIKESLKEYLVQK